MSIQANLFELHGFGMGITFSTTSISGEPQLTLHQRDAEPIPFTGPNVDETVMGTVVTVDMGAVPDLHTRYITVLIPLVHLKAENETADVATLAIETTHGTSIGGPELVFGQVTGYNFTSLRGIARKVQFQRRGGGGIIRIRMKMQ